MQTDGGTGKPDMARAGWSLHKQAMVICTHPSLLSGHRGLLVANFYKIKKFLTSKNKFI
jgi:uracil DNA glycosylase